MEKPLPRDYAISLLIHTTTGMYLGLELDTFFGLNGYPPPHNRGQLVNSMGGILGDQPITLTPSLVWMGPGVMGVLVVWLCVQGWKPGYFGRYLTQELIR